jgi:hypothetical protein
MPRLEAPRLAASVLVLCTVLAVVPLAAQPAAESGFLAGTEDVPLLKGLSTDPATLVVFDKPQGRIVEVEAQGAVSRAAVEKFYATSLPQLGWSADGRNAWRREKERLRLAFKGQDGDLRVTFSLAPR